MSMGEDEEEGGGGENEVARSVGFRAWVAR